MADSVPIAEIDRIVERLQIQLGGWGVSTRHPWRFPPDKQVLELLQGMSEGVRDLSALLQTLPKQRTESDPSND